jgi:peroxiredoxin
VWPVIPTPTLVNVIRPGELVPDVDLRTADGRVWRFSEHRGRPLLLILHRHLA